MAQKSLGQQMAALRSLDETNDSIADRSNSLLNATCPGRIQNNSNSSFLDDSRVVRRVKREPLRISPLEQIDENPSRRRSSRSPNTSRRYVSKNHDNYKTKLCESFRRHGHCSYIDRCQYAHGSDELRIPPRRKTYSRGESSRYHRDGLDESFGGYGYADEFSQNRRYHTRINTICRNFERGSCRYGPRCKYIHREQMQCFEPNATVYVAPDTPMQPFYQNGQCFVPQYYVPQYVPVDMNQTMPMFPTQQVPMQGTTYFLQPMSATPIMGQPADPTQQQMMMVPEQTPQVQPMQPLPKPATGATPMDPIYEQFPEFFQRPPPPLGQI